MLGWCKVKNAAKYADVSERTIREWLKEGLKHSRLPSGTIRIRYIDIDGYLEQFQVNDNLVDAVVEEIINDFS
jgi:excisionase family DNA binding protein